MDQFYIVLAIDEIQEKETFLDEYSARHAAKVKAVDDEGKEFYVVQVIGQAKASKVTYTELTPVIPF